METSVEIVIPREKAVFWLDRNGCWRNVHGRFRNKKIIDHFHAAIGKDEGGYFVAQDRGASREKVYFPYEDTALFVFDVVKGEGVRLILNTGREMDLDPAALFIRDDALYLRDGEESVKFTDRVLLRISDLLDEAEGGIYIRVSGVRYRIPES